MTKSTKSQDIFGLWQSPQNSRNHRVAIQQYIKLKT